MRIACVKLTPRARRDYYRSVLPGDPRLATPRRPAEGKIGIAVRCGGVIVTEALPDGAVDEVAWLRDAIDRLVAAGASGALFVFISQPPDRRLADVLEAARTVRRLQPSVVAAPTALASRAGVELLEQAGVAAVYLALHGATATVSGGGTGERESLRRGLLWLTSAPKFLLRMRVGVCFELTPETAPQLAGVLRLLGKLERGELLLWDGSRGDPVATRMAPSAALRVLDGAVTTAQRLGVHVRPVGFERLRTAAAPVGSEPCVASPAMIELLREAVPLPSAGGGLRATWGAAITIAEAVRTGPDLVQVACEFAGGGRPFVDLPPCLGGPPPGDAARLSAEPAAKVDACRSCPIEEACAGVPLPLLAMPDVRSVVAPPPHWMPIPERARIAVVCPVATEDVYGATFFSLARCLVRLGARVDVVTPWEIHADVPASFSEVQRLGEPPDGSAVAAFMIDAPVEPYDVIVTPDPKVTRPLVASGRLRSHTRLAITDFHMLGGIDGWVQDHGVRGRRAEEGGWWPSDRIMLYSAFPGYARLYTRYGVPMQHVTWQPYAVDPTRFEIARPATEGTTIISAGHHRRDLDTLFSAVRRLGGNVHPIELFGPSVDGDVPPPVHFRGTVPARVFCPEVGHSRFMVVPLVDDPDNAAGITALVTAIVCGRPVVATATSGTRDYVVDGVNGLLVPPRDPQAMADAIARLDRDPKLLAALAAGARAAAPMHTTEAWARALVHGSRTFDDAHWMWRKWRHRRA
jgi:glycosyltransferase involved in cell wall biosynthesis